MRKSERMRSIRSGEGKIVRAVGDEFVAERLEDFAVVEKEDAGHAFDVTGGSAEEVAAAPGGEHADHVLGIQILMPLGAEETEGIVKNGGGIGEARKVIEAMRGEEFLGAGLGGQMDKAELSAAGLDLGAKFFELEDGFAAKGTAKVAEENEQHGSLGRERRDRRAVLRGVGVEEFGLQGGEGGHARQMSTRIMEEAKAAAVTPWRQRRFAAAGMKLRWMKRSDIGRLQ